MNSIKMIASTVVTLIVLGGGVFVYMDMAEQERLAEEKRVAEQRTRDEQIAKEQAIAARTKCTQMGSYFVVTQDRENTVGQDILVKTNPDGAQLSCQFAASDADFSLVNSDAQYLKAVEKKAVVVDVGTGPSGRNLRIYDLGDKSMVTEKKYFGEIKIENGILTYFGLAKQKADKKNCKEYDQLMKDFGNANLVIEKQVNLETYLVKEGKTTKCVAEQ